MPKLISVLKQRPKVDIVQNAYENSKPVTNAD